MSATADPAYTIVGAGLAGALFANYLAQAGRRVDVYEKRPDPRTHELERGRSINLALSVRGLHALKEIGQADAVLAQAIAMRGRMMHDRSGRLTFQPYGKDESEVIYSVSRGELNQILVKGAARFDSVRWSFRQRCTGVELHTGDIELTDEDTHESRRETTQVVIGADGAFSAVRNALQRQERFDYSQDYLGHGYKELTMPAGPGGEHAMEKHALHIWPRGTYMLIALPNLDGSFTCTLFWPFEGPHSFAALRTADAVRSFFEQEFPDALARMPDLADDFLTNPTGSLVTIRCHPWNLRDRVVLIGDACHAVVPFLGQGMNAAFEDCTVLSRCLAAHGPDREAAFHAYTAQRKPHVDALADLAVQNFIEMRDKVGSRLFLAKKKGENYLHWLLPRWYVPLYNLVTHTRTPYADAVRRARLQSRIVVGAAALLMLILLVMVWRL